MGYIRHHAIIVTTWSEEHAESAYKTALLFFPAAQVAPRQTTSVNSYYTVFVGPDGSKEYWPDSDMGDWRREQFVNWLRSERYEDGSSPFAWVEVQYGDDEYETAVVNSSDDDYLRTLEDGGEQ